MLIMAVIREPIATLERRINGMRHRTCGECGIEMPKRYVRIAQLGKALNEERIVTKCQLSVPSAIHLDFGNDAGVLASA